MATSITNTNPIVATGTGGMASDYWTTISVPTGQGKPIKVKKIQWMSPGASGSFVITDNSSAANVLFQGATPASFAGQDVEYDFAGDEQQWRNWKITTLSAGTLMIFYH